MNRPPNIAAIVEGDGDVAAVPGLLRRILGERLFRYDIQAAKPKQAHGKPNLLKKFEQFLQYAIIDNCDAILVILDADEECPVNEARTLAIRAAALSLAVPVAIVYTKSEYETWFIASLSEGTGATIRARLGIPDTVHAPDNLENIRGAKGWLNERMPDSRAYKETEDQGPLTHHIDLDLTHLRSRSFRRLCHAVDELVDSIDQRLTAVTP